MNIERNNIVKPSAMERWKRGRLKKTIKELSQFDNKKPDELEAEFDHFDLDNSYPSSPSKAITS